MAAGQRRIAPSKLSCPGSVPATPLTLTAVRTAVPPYACGAHATVVADVHALLSHTPAAISAAVAVGPRMPKLRPLIVTVPPALGAALAGALPLTTGAAIDGGWACTPKLWRGTDRKRFHAAKDVTYRRR